jgi:hypothetical protein
VIRIVANWLNRLFRMEEINGAERCPTYLFRWTLVRFRSFAVYLHHFVGDDWARDLHDHPKRFISIGLRGRYKEETPSGERIFRAPWIRSFPATHVHRILMVDGSTCWTLVIVLNAVRTWGFWTDNGWVPWRRYVSDDSIARKNCP